MSIQNSHQVSDVKVMLVKGLDGSSIGTITKTSTSGLTDTYTITLTDGSKTEFEVTNGNGIVSIEKTATSGNIDTYTITFNDGDTFDFTVANGADEASRVAFDPTGTALPSSITNVQDAIAELAKMIPSVTVTLTINGALEDIVTVKNSDDEIVATCVFESNQTSGTCQVNVPNDGGTYTFESGVAEIASGVFYSKTVTLTNASTQTVNLYPDVCWHWFGNKLGNTLIVPAATAVITDVTHGLRITTGGNSHRSECIFTEPIAVSRSEVTKIRAVVMPAYGQNDGTVSISATYGTGTTPSIGSATFSSGNLNVIRYIEGNLADDAQTGYGRIYIYLGRAGAAAYGELYALYCD